VRFVAARTRPNTMSAQAFDLKVLFAVVARELQTLNGQRLVDLSRRVLT
jgi:hypothetical protein